LTSNSGNSARAQLIETRRGTWIDKSLLPAARRECLDVLREAARKAVDEATYMPGYISDATDSVQWDLTAGCIDTGLPAGRRNFGQSVKTLIETANVPHAR
jgi:hypothetical protein